MSNETDIDLQNDTETTEDVSAVNQVTEDEYQKAKAAGITKITTLVATYSHMTAELTVEYWWTNGGGTLRAYTLQYRVTSNGNNSGNITFAINGHGGQSWKNELTRSAIQDGKWHPIANGGWVGSPLMKGDLYFHYVFDRSNTGDWPTSTREYVAYP